MLPLFLTLRLLLLHHPVRTLQKLSSTANVTPSSDDQLKLWNKCSVITCKQLQNMFELGKYVVKAKVAFIDEDEGWITFACNKCHKYAGPRFPSDASKAEYECDNYGPVTDVNPRWIRTGRYRGDDGGSVIMVMVAGEDGGGNADGCDGGD
ncbi:uncharacterized protein [Rutidosis leptorrhynchoides]|uniref:uncharacterized protein n=1 Tax=Rutidosis leptorrhynchoides TaxID=125765 RepID=UPI003A98ED9F